MKPVLDWIRTNIFTVVFGVVMITAVIAVPMLAGSLNRGVQEAMDKRARTLRDLDQLGKTQIVVAGETHQTLINQQLLDRYRTLMSDVGRDAGELYAAAEERNRRERGVLLDEMFPEPPPRERETLPSDFHQRVIEAHDDLLESIRAGAPPSVEEVQDLMERRRAQFISRDLQKEPSDSLTTEEQRQLTEALTRARLNLYTELAESIGVYATPDELALPTLAQQDQPTMTELFDWQWRYWICDDVLSAIGAANADSSNVIMAPVKRVLGLSFQAPVPPGGAGPGRGGGGGAASAMGMGGGRGGAAAGGPAPQPIDPARDIPRSYEISFTGRATNPVYDVRNVRLDVIVDTERLPELMDALARQNFMTVLDLDLRSVDAYEAIQQGYVYGASPVSEVSLEIETIWFRSWTSEFMPDEVRRALGVPAKVETEAAAPMG